MLSFFAVLTNTLVNLILRAVCMVAFGEKMKAEANTSRVFLSIYIPYHIWNTDQCERVMYVLVSSESGYHLAFNRC